MCLPNVLQSPGFDLQHDIQPGVAVYAEHQEAETGGSEVQGCLCLQSHEASLRHMRPSLKKAKEGGGGGGGGKQHL